LICSNIG